LAAQVDERSTARSSQRLAVQPARQPAATKESIINELPLKHHTTARYGIPGSIFLWPKQKFNISRRIIPLIHAKLLEAREEPTGNILCASNTTRSTNVSQAQEVSLKNSLSLQIWDPSPYRCCGGLLLGTDTRSAKIQKAYEKQERVNAGAT